MNLELHWFLAATGDGRTLVRGGHSVKEFLLYRSPHVEEAYWFPEEVMPLLRWRDLPGDDSTATGPRSPSQAA